MEEKIKKLRPDWEEYQVDGNYIHPWTRFLTLSARQQDGDTWIYVGSSDSILRVFKLTASNTIDLVDELDFQQHCILKVKQFNLGEVPHLLCCTTAGRVSVWNPVAMEKLTEFSIHQSGINSVDVGTELHSVVVGTGGDDGALVVTRLEYKAGVLQHQVVWREDRAHTAHVTGLYFVGTYIHALKKVCGYWLINKTFKQHIVH